MLNRYGMYFGGIMAVSLFLLVYNTSHNEAQDEVLRSASAITQETRQIVLETIHEPVIYPHKHAVGDSLFNPAHHRFINSPIMSVPEDLWVTGIEVQLHNAPASVLHHAVLYSIDEMSNTCANGQRKELANLGEDTLHTPSVHFAAPYGIYLRHGTPLLLNTMIHNPLPPVGAGETYEDVYVTLTLYTEPATTSTRSKRLDYYLMHLDDNPCTGYNFAFTVPEHTIDFTYTESSDTDLSPGTVTFETSGTIVYAGAHLHGWEGGKTLSVLHNDTPIRTHTTQRSNEHSYVWETYHGVENISIKAGDTLKIMGTYDNPDDVPIIGAMAMYAFYFAPDQ